MIWYLSPLSLIPCNSLYFELGKTRYAILKIKWNSFQNLFLHFFFMTSFLVNSASIASFIHSFTRSLSQMYSEVDRGLHLLELVI